MDEQEIACDNGTFEGSVILRTQQEVDDFGALCYSKIEGSLVIQENNMSEQIIDLSALESLREVSDELFIGSGHFLTLKGLENLHTVTGVLSLNGLKSTSLIELENLTVVGFLGIGHSRNLTSLNGLQSIISLNGLSLHSNEVLSSINALSNVTTSIWDHRVEIGLCPQLTSMAGLENVTYTYRLNLYENDGLVSLNGLQNLNTVNHLIIDGCDGLVDLEGLNNLENTLSIDNNLPYSISIYNNSSLLSLDGIENVKYLDGLIVGTENSPNSQLSDFCALENWSSNGIFDSSSINIENNAFNPSMQDIIDGNCSQ